MRPRNPLGWLPTTRGLALYYSFDRVGDGVVTNLVGDKHVGKLNGAKWSKVGLRGGAMRLESSARVQVVHDPELCPPFITLAAWLKPQGNQSGYRVVVGKTAASSWNDGYAFVRMPGSGREDDGYLSIAVRNSNEYSRGDSRPFARWKRIWKDAFGTSARLRLPQRTR